jgi:plastocyanin
MSRTSTRHPTGRIALVTALASGALLLGGCGDSGSSPPASTDSMGSMGSMTMGSSPMSGSSKSSTPTAVTIEDFAFHGPSSVAPGAEVTVTNQDAEAHTLTADGSGGFDVKIDPGASATFTAPTKPGSYPFHCTYHGNMQGTLTVR